MECDLHNLNLDGLLSKRDLKEVNVKVAKTWWRSVSNSNFLEWMKKVKLDQPTHDDVKYKADAEFYRKMARKYIPKDLGSKNQVITKLEVRNYLDDSTGRWDIKIPEKEDKVELFLGQPWAKRVWDWWLVVKKTKTKRHGNKSKPL